MSSNGEEAYKEVVEQDIERSDHKQGVCGYAHQVLSLEVPV
jgi:hypothetical protein